MLGDLVDGEYFFDMVTDDVVYEVLYAFPGWPRAQQQIVEAETRGSWEPLPEEPQVTTPITTAEATERVLKDAETGRRLSKSTLGKYRLMLGHIEDAIRRVRIGPLRRE